MGIYSKTKDTLLERSQKNRADIRPVPFSSLPFPVPFSPLHTLEAPRNARNTKETPEAGNLPHRRTKTDTDKRDVLHPDAQSSTTQPTIRSKQISGGFRLPEGGPAVGAVVAMGGEVASSPHGPVVGGAGVPGLPRSK